VHAHEPQAATQKAKDLVRMGVAKARLLSAMKEETIGVNPKGLVIGGGLSGMTAALALADQGFDCYLVEKEQELGGHLRGLFSTLHKNDPQKLLSETAGKVKNHPRITLFTGTEISTISGYIGNFTTTIGSNGASRELAHGIIVVATGADEYQPDEYLYGRHDGVVTQKQLGAKLAAEAYALSDIKDVVMIQCVGSRTKQHPYCSKLCCNTAIKNALKIKELNPSANVYILYKDIRSYGFNEEFYTEARRKGVMFLRYDDAAKPVVQEEDGGLTVSVLDPLLNERIMLRPSLVALAAAVVPAGNDKLSKLLKVPLNAEGFFQEAHVKLRPVDFATDGVFVCGLAHSPKSMDEAISQAHAAAARAAIPLARGYVRVEPVVSSVNEDACFGCGICEYLCPYGSITVRATEAGDKARTISASCKGCGVCASKCPRKAITMGRFTDEQILSQINALVEN
jgi:heterodisulfide reductase subunit A